ncbi:MAG: hypothetical protein ABSB94_17430 [Syntrophorhabdales bacterium]|jgi:hypothetical protein
MEILYITWGMLLFLFVGMLLVLRAKEGKATRRRDSATDPMFRRPSASGHR